VITNGSGIVASVIRGGLLLKLTTHLDVQYAAVMILIRITGGIKMKRLSSKITYVLVYSDNYQGEVFTHEAYKQLRLSMSTGDFNSHRFMVVPQYEIDPDETIIQVEDLNMEQAA
jgi:hypothetical protein